MNLNQRVKSLRVLDIALIKLGVVASTLFILTVWPPHNELGSHGSLGMVFNCRPNPLGQTNV